MHIFSILYSLAPRTILAHASAPVKLASMIKRKHSAKNSKMLLQMRKGAKKRKYRQNPLNNPSRFHRAAQPNTQPTVLGVKNMHFFHLAEAFVDATICFCSSSAMRDVNSTMIFPCSSNCKSRRSASSFCSRCFSFLFFSFASTRFSSFQR